MVMIISLPPAHAGFHVSTTKGQGPLSASSPPYTTGPNTASSATLCRFVARLIASQSMLTAMVIPPISHRVSSYRSTCMSGSTPDRSPGTRGVAEILVATDAHQGPRPCSCPASPPADEPQLIFAITDRTQRASKPTFRTPRPDSVTIPLMPRGIPSRCQ